MLSVLPLAMRMGGPREAVWHALIRQNYGASHFILGRDHAGPGANSQGKDFYAPFDARDYALSVQHRLPHITLAPSDMLVYSPTTSSYEPEASLRSSGLPVHQLSGTALRRLLNQGAPIPAWFSFPAVERILRAAHPPLHRRGFAVLFTGLSGAGKSAIANALVERLLARQVAAAGESDSRSVTLLDGDVVRQMLSSELGFSAKDRNLNIQRIGYVCSLLVRAGGIAIAAPIAPYAHSRALARAACEAASGGKGFFEVHVSAPLSVCEQRDRKGLYARVRAGQLQHFTGVDDPYEAPEKAEVVIAPEQSIEQAVQAIVDSIVQQGFLLPAAEEEQQQVQQADVKSQ